MTKEQWQNFNSGLVNNYFDSLMGLEVLSPDNWNEYKSKMTRYINNIDELTRIYNEENKAKQ